MGRVLCCAVCWFMRVVAGLFLVLLVLVGCSRAAVPSGPAPEPVVAREDVPAVVEPVAVTIRLTGDGFVPEVTSLVANRSSRVRFVNELDVAYAFVVAMDGLSRPHGLVVGPSNATVVEVVPQRGLYALWAQPRGNATREYRGQLTVLEVAR